MIFALAALLLGIGVYQAAPFLAKERKVSAHTNVGTPEGQEPNALFENEEENIFQSCICPDPTGPVNLKRTPTGMIKGRRMHGDACTATEEYMGCITNSPSIR